MRSKVENLLESDHREIDRLLDRLLAALDRRDLDGVVQNLDLFWARLAMHIRAEHHHLFPAVLSAQGIDDLDPTPTIAELRRDHHAFMHELAGAMKDARSLRREGSDQNEMLENLQERVRRVRQRLIGHNLIEEERIYRLADERLSPSETETLVSAIKHELETLPARFINSDNFDWILT